LGNSVCTFWIGKRCYALDTALVGEVVNVETTTPVPLAPSAVVGLFNLRGTPVALVDLANVLDLPEGYQGKGEQKTALVLRKGSVLGAVLIDRMEVVIPVGQGYFTPRQGDEHPVVQGFLEVDVRGGLVLTVLDATALLQRFERLKYR
jgi:purine-binding chemotaxis protein CheW